MFMAQLTKYLAVSLLHIAPTLSQSDMGEAWKYTNIPILSHLQSSMYLFHDLLLYNRSKLQMKS
jgi:hypothetical protein